MDLPEIFPQCSPALPALLSMHCDHLKIQSKGSAAQGGKADLTPCSTHSTHSHFFSVLANASWLTPYLPEPLGLGSTSLNHTLKTQPQQLEITFVRGDDPLCSFCKTQIIWGEKWVIFNVLIQIKYLSLWFWRLSLHTICSAKLRLKEMSSPGKGIPSGFAASHFRGIFFVWVAQDCSGVNLCTLPKQEGKTHFCLEKVWRRRDF